MGAVTSVFQSGFPWPPLPQVPPRKKGSGVSTPGDGHAQFDKHLFPKCVCSGSSLTLGWCWGEYSVEAYRLQTDRRRCGSQAAVQKGSCACVLASCPGLRPYDQINRTIAL